MKAGVGISMTEPGKPDEGSAFECVEFEMTVSHLTLSFDSE